MLNLYYIKKIDGKWELIEIGKKVTFSKVRTAYQGLQSLPTDKAVHIEIQVEEE